MLQLSTLKTAVHLQISNALKVTCETCFHPNVMFGTHAFHKYFIGKKLKLVFQMERKR